MPNFDRGHYFLTALAPVKTDDLADGYDLSRPHVEVLRDVLACLSLASPPLACPPLARPLTAPPNNDAGSYGIVSPFARNGRTHRARFVVIDDVANDPSAMPQEADHLSSPFLLFAADFDAASGGDAELERYLAELWDTMAAELVAVFQHCVGFEAVKDAAAFGAYIERCQVETTMPVNDYGTAPPPAAPDPDLPSILEALDLQRAFAAFAEAARDRDAKTLYRDFGAFLATHKPRDADGPTRVPGVIGSGRLGQRLE